MGSVIGLLLIVAYYATVSQFIDGGSSPPFMVGVAYVLVPLIGIPMIVSAVRSSFPAGTGRRHIKAFVSSAAIVGITTAGVLGAAKLSMPSQSRFSEAVDQEQLQANWVVAGQEAVKAKLKDPESAEFKGLYFFKGKDGVPVTCGEVNSKNAFGGYTGFQRFISAGSAELTFLQEQMSANDFTASWNTFCSR